MTDEQRGPGASGEDLALAQDLRATEESIVVDAERLADLEETKADLDPHDPAIARLSTDAVRLARRIELQARAELQLSRNIG